MEKKKINIYVMLPIHKQAVFTDIETDNIVQTVKELATRYFFAICCVECGREKREYYRYTGEKVFYDHTIKRWISKEEYRRRKHELL